MVYDTKQGVSVEKRVKQSGPWEESAWGMGGGGGGVLSLQKTSA